MNDFILTNHDSFYLLVPTTEAAREWVVAHFAVGDAVAIAPEYVKRIVRAFQQEGLVLQHD